LQRFKIVEGRASKYGRITAEVVNQIVDLLPEEARQNYITRFRIELETYSLVHRKKGMPMNEGCKMELEEITNADIFDPEIMARWVKEGMHLTYLKGTSKRIKNSLLDNLKMENG
jgi:hypothetical protein